MTVVSTRAPWETPATETACGVRRIWVPVPAGKAMRAAALTLGGLIAIWRRRSSFDVLHAHQMFSQTTLGLLAGALVGCPLIVNPHRGGAQGDVHKLLRKGRVGRMRLELIRRRAAAFVAISEEIAVELGAIGVDPTRIARLPNPVDVERFRPATDSDRADLRLQLGLPIAEPLIVYAGRLDAIKGLDLLIDAMAGVRGYLVIVGAGDERAALEACAARQCGGASRRSAAASVQCCRERAHG